MGEGILFLVVDAFRGKDSSCRYTSAHHHPPSVHFAPSDRWKNLRDAYTAVLTRTTTPKAPQHSSLAVHTSKPFSDPSAHLAVRHQQKLSFSASAPSFVPQTCSPRGDTTVGATPRGNTTVGAKPSAAVMASPASTGSSPRKNQKTPAPANYRYFYQQSNGE